MIAISAISGTVQPPLTSRARPRRVGPTDASRYPAERVSAVNAATAAAPAPRSTGRINPSPSEPPWPRPMTIIQSAAAPGASEETEESRAP